MVIPIFESGFLTELADAFRKRRKSLRHRGSVPEIFKVYQQRGDEVIERLEIALEDNTQKNGAVLRLNATPDRKIVVSARKLSKNREGWSWRYDGKLLGTHGGRDAIAALEETCELLPRVEQSNLDILAAPWRHLLARGPREL
jgi:hypothetical protein